MNALRKTRISKTDKLKVFRLYGGAGACSMFALCCIALAQMGFGEKRLKMFETNVRGLLQMKIFGEKADSEQVIEHVKRKYGIDAADLIELMEFELTDED